MISKSTIEAVVAVTWIVSLLVGCAPALAPDGAGAADAATPLPDGGVVETSGAFTHAIHDDGSITTVADAADEEAWRYLDLDTRADDGAAERWDLGFSRFRIRTNGGASGEGGVALAALGQADFEAVARAPDDGYRVDQPDSEADADSEPDNAFNGGEEDWYAYNVMSHTLSPLPLVYVVRSTEARFYKLQIENYYDEAGTPGKLAFAWAEIGPPAMPQPPDEEAGADASVPDTE